MRPLKNNNTPPFINPSLFLQAEAGDPVVLPFFSLECALVDISHHFR
jgi:hypothetical protein